MCRPLSKFLIAVAAAVCLTATANAQSITNQPDPATRNGNDVTVKAKGFYSVPPSNRSWQIRVSYGTIVNGTFTEQAAPAPYIALGPFGLKAGGGPLAWTGHQQVLVNAPANLVVRAELQRSDVFGLNYSTVATADFVIP
jgi:hypothetical protein